MAGVAFRSDYPFNVNVVMLATLFFAGVLCGGWLVHGALRARKQYFILFSRSGLKRRWNGTHRQRGDHAR